MIAGDDVAAPAARPPSWSSSCWPRSCSADTRVTTMPAAVEMISAGHLRHQAVADGEQRVVLGGAARRSSSCWTMPMAKPADDVDEDDDDAGDRVAADELAGTVHRAVEVGLLRDLAAAPARLVLADQAGVQVGVDRHLLAGHRVQREARRDLGDAAGALGDDHEVDDDQDRRTRRCRRRSCRRPRSGRRPRSPCPAASGPVWPCSRTTRVEATFSDSRSSVVTSSTVGKGENSSGLQRVHRHQQDHQRQRDVEGEQQVEHERSAAAAPSSPGS